MAHLWRGVLREFADRLGVTDESTVITLGEGGTPLLPAVDGTHEARRGMAREVLNQWQGGDRVVAFADALDPIIRHLGEQFEASLYDLRWRPKSLN